jgi:hypothetical protein
VVSRGEPTPPLPAGSAPGSMRVCVARQHLRHAEIQERHRLVHIRFANHQGRHEAHRALPAGQENQAVVIRAGNDGIAQLLGGARLVVSVMSSMPIMSPLPRISPTIPYLPANVCSFPLKYSPTLAAFAM